METVTDFISLGFKITASGDFSHEIKRCLLIGRKTMTNLDSVFKSRNITLLKDVHLVKAMLFPAVMYGCESWSKKKAECWRIDTFELWSWRRLLRVPWTARRSKQSILKEINPEYSLEGLMLKLKLQYFGHLMWRANSLEKTWCSERLRQEDKGMTEDKTVGWHHWLNGHEFEQAPGDGEGQGSLACCRPWVTKSWTWLSNWTTTTLYMGFPGGSDGKEFACNAGDSSLIPGLGRYPWEGNGYPLQYSCLDNPMDSGA